MSLSLDWYAICAQYRKDLFDDFLPFFEKYVLDHEYGGFLCSVRPSGELVSTEKRLWYEGRGTWVYSYLYHNIAKEEKYLEAAARSVRLIERSEPDDPEEFWPKLLKRDGSPASPPDTEVYSDMFIAEGLAEFSRASGQSEYWDKAKQIVLKCVRRYDRPDYHPAIGQTYLGPSARPFPGARVLGVWMVLLRATTQMLAMRFDAELQQISDRSLEAILSYHFNPRFRLLNELINHDLSRPDNEYEQLVYAGHAMEILWMVLDEARRRKDAALFERAGDMFRRHCEVARDRVYGGLWRNLMHVDRNLWTMDKTLFPHQEALIGSMILIEETGHPWAVEFYREINGYMREKFPLRSFPSPIWQLQSNRWSDPTPELTRAENYHQPRMIMLNLQAVERILLRIS